MAAEVWVVEFYVEPGGRRPVNEFVGALDVKSKARLLAAIEQLRARNVDACEALVRHLEGKLGSCGAGGGDATMSERKDYTSEGQRAYEEWRDTFMADPKNRRIYEEEAAKGELWLQLVEARQATGMTQAEVAKRLGVSQAQVARIEKRGYESYTLNTLRRYIQALGEGF